MTKEEIIEHFQLEPHPEGGYFRELYRSKGIILKSALDPSFSGDRNHSTSIYFLLTSDNFSAFHKVKQDESWHFYQGDAIELHMISPKGEHSKIVIGHDYRNGQVPQFIVPGGYWFAAKVMKPNSFAFVGCGVAPGFDFDDFALAKRDELLKAHPHLDNLIKLFTRS
jgi:predicted cupin superfamily sugar epimerase